MTRFGDEQLSTASPPAATGVGGIVLAAGQSTRMGSPKALLDWNGRTFIEQAIASLLEGGCTRVVAVVGTGPGHQEAARLARAAGADIVVNPDPASKQLDSLRLGVRALGDAAGAAMLPVDHPAVRPETVAAVLAAFRATAAPIVRPVVNGKGGHPTLFARSIFGQLLSAPLPGGARELVRSFDQRKVEIPLADAGSAADVDTPDELARLRARFADPATLSRP